MSCKNGCPNGDCDPIGTLRAKLRALSASRRRLRRALRYEGIAHYRETAMDALRDDSRAMRRSTEGGKR